MFKEKVESDYTLNLGTSKYACLPFFEMFTIVDFALHVKSKQWASLLGIHNRKMFEKLRVCVSVCKSECRGIVIGITQRLNLTCLFYNFCFVKQLFTISSFYSLLSEYSQIERRFVYFFAGTLSAFPKRVTRFNTYEVEVNNLKCIRSMQHTAL